MEFVRANSELTYLNDGIRRVDPFLCRATNAVLPEVANGGRIRRIVNTSVRSIAWLWRFSQK